MEGYICLMGLMALVFGVPLILAHNRISALDLRIRSMESRMTDPSPAAQTAEAPEPTKTDDMPPVINELNPPLAEPEPLLPTESAPASGDSVAPQETSEPIADPIPVLHDMADQPNSPELPNVPEPVAAHTVETPEAKEPAGANNSFELEVGKVWFVRIGVVLVLTGLVFLAKMGYKNISDHIRPYLNASLLYLISFGMMGAGLFLRERFAVLKNYGEVLTGGGMAAVYFSTYALYFVKAPVL
ncbi:MAG: hypothetical protein CMO67_04285, partial [Verrucomicrobiales bacterium]|nr:hypothetical protein [Verrucomicrobiales bacterium]